MQGITFLPNKVINSVTLKEIIRNNNLKQQKKSFIKRGKFEIEALKKVKNVIGRTDWDRACVELINPKINYFKCNEILRETFYKSTWQLDQCQKYSIFVSQSDYPIKGFHLALETLANILLEYPEAQLYTTGESPFPQNIKDKLLLSTYQKYIMSLIDKYNLKDKVIFYGKLNGIEMKEAYLKAHVFLSCSSIENSPNSVGEAMILGMPVVSSDVGGVNNLLEHNKTGFLYQADAPYMAAYYIKKIFSDNNLTSEITCSAHQSAETIYNVKKNNIDLNKIYELIYKNYKSKIEKDNDI